MSIGFGRVLLGGKRGAVLKIPTPSNDGARAGSGQIGELYGSGRTGQSKAGLEIGCREGINGDIVRLSNRIGTAAVLDDQGYGIGSGIAIRDVRVLKAGDLSIAKIPGPGYGTSTGRVLKCNGKWPTAGYGIGREIRNRGLCVNAQGTNQEKASD